MHDSKFKVQTRRSSNSLRVCILKLAFCILIALSAGACASSGNPRPRPFPGAPPPPESTPSTPAEPAVGVAVEPSAIVDTALKLRGVPYRNGGSDPSGFDCSGFVQWVFAKNGVLLPREAREQYGAGQKIGLRDVQPGDLVFFHTVSRGASHVGVVIGGDQFVHAPSSTGVVRVERFTAAYWARRFVGARRIDIDSSHRATE
jgi:cell wall-associated NlpC family hydrolase